MNHIWGKESKRTMLSFVAVLLCMCICFGVLFGCKPDEIDNPSKSNVPSYETEISPTGTVSGYPQLNARFAADYKTKQETLDASRLVNIQLAEEGMVLLKNDGALPLTSAEKNVSLFGNHSASLRTGGGGSGVGKTDIYGIASTSLKKSLEDAGFKVNAKLYDFYTKHTGNVETAPTQIGAEIEQTYGSYGDAAVLVFARSGAEGSDLPRSNVAGHSDKSEHYLELMDNEKALVKYAKKHFQKVIVLLNSAHIMEIGNLNEEKTTDNLGVDAILQIGHVGNDGAVAIGRILNGTVNPSGHTVDTWPGDFTKTPSYNNFGDNSQAGGETQMYLSDGTVANRWYAVEYREDIYVGYRYYETKWYEMNKADENSGDRWYSDNVVYPFGYGLSYTTFDWKLDKSIVANGDIVKPNGTITMKVVVTNTGKVAGKDVVQIYAQQPYTSGGIEKAHSVLVGFAKTKLLAPGESDNVSVQFVAQDMASFDAYDKNNNGFVGYELEKGDYVISARRNAHDVGLSVTRTIRESIKCPIDVTTGAEIKAWFSQNDGKWADYNSTNESLLANLMTRDADMAQPKTTTKAERTLGKAEYAAIEDRRDDYIYEDDPDDSWYIASVPSTWKQGEGFNGEKTRIQLKDMIGVSFTAPTVDESGNVTVGTDEGSQKWEAFLNQIPWSELQSISSNANYGRPANNVVGKPKESDSDGPSQIGGLGGDKDRMGTYWVSPVIISSSYNVTLAEQMGRQVGNECLFVGIDGWYGPGANTHRSPFGGRNFEYYSEDGVLGGKIAAAVCNGATSKGVVTYIKHIAVNDQETKRDSDRGLFTFVTEQAMREIYLKPFELAIKEGHANGTMNCANRIGTWVGYSHGALHTGLLRTEWGFKGMTITDAGGGGMDFSHGNSLIRNGISCPLGASRYEETEYRNGMVYGKSQGASTFDLASPTQWYWTRLAVMYDLYTTINSAGIDGGLASGQVITVKIKLGEAVNIKVLNVSNYGTDEVSNVVVDMGTLPMGTTLSTDGVLIGTPTKAGTFGAQITCIGNNWATTTLKLRIVVE